MANEKILIVDDEDVLCLALQRLLSEAGYETDFAISGEKSLKMAEAKMYDLIYVDATMPGMDGIETCRALKKVTPDSEIVFITGNFKVDPIQKEIDFIKAGGKTFTLYKPFSEDEILSVTKKVLLKK